MTTRPYIIIISGLSGAGKTVALRALEDSGFFCADNLPPQLINDFVKISINHSKANKIGIGIDIREKEFLNELEGIVNASRKRYIMHKIFLEAGANDLIRRYKETRRPHPLDHLTDGDISKAIAMESKLLEPLREQADRIIDTSAMTPHQLRHHIISIFGDISVDVLKITLISFGFKYGIPQHLDMLFEARFLPNPHFIPELRALTGKDDKVKDFVLSDKSTTEFLGRIEGLVDFLIPEYIKEGRAYLTIGIGCTGGRHRSPAIIEWLYGVIIKHKVIVEVVHRDI
ncbi:MAG: RNase adapter RapZ [Nitrospirae bacterium]|nr:RNase adapter RapZ [Nitrospirota bacterium]MBF0542351.1 RNase adapter RapZ [Nitrospirota bacterium]